MHDKIVGIWRLNLQGPTCTLEKLKEGYTGLAQPLTVVTTIYHLDRDELTDLKYIVEHALEKLAQ